MHDDRVATATHEAGHAVVARLLGLQFKSVTIVASESALGCVSFDPPPSWFTPDTEWNDDIRRLAHAFIVVSLAGPVAESTLTGHDRPLVGSWDHDYSNIAELLLRTSGSAERASQLNDELLTRTRDTLSDSTVWRAVQHLAAVLLAEQTMDAARAVSEIATVLAADDPCGDISRALHD